MIDISDVLDNSANTDSILRAFRHSSSIWALKLNCLSKDTANNVTYYYILFTSNLIKILLLLHYFLFSHVRHLNVHFC